MSLNKFPMIKVSRIYPIPHKNNIKRIKKESRSQFNLPQATNITIQDALKKQGQTLLNNKVIHLFNGNYKGYKESSIQLAEFATKNFDVMKTLARPKITFHLLNPFNIFYWARMARVLIKDAFRTKTPAEIQYVNMGKAEYLKKQTELAGEFISSKRNTNLSV
jgi:hypothetical protein